MLTPFEQKYIKHLASIANTYSDVLIKTRRAKEILKYKSIELGKPRRSNYVVELIKNLRP